MPGSHLPLELSPISLPLQSFKFIVEAWGHSYTMREQVALIESLEPCCRFDVSSGIGCYLAAIAPAWLWLE